MSTKTEIAAGDIIDAQTYAAIRKQRRAEMIERKKSRRLALGPYATMHFENFETMHYQVQEMLHTQKGGAAQLVDELAAYNPLVPKGNELVGTFMLEFEDPLTRPDILRGLTGIEKTIVLTIGADKVSADCETDVERTAPDGMTSSIHFVRFHLNDKQAQRFRDTTTPVTLGIEHVNYSHVTAVDGAARNDLIRDL